MARKLRVQYSGAIYHVMNRGDRREPIFKDDQDRECFLATLGEACAPSRRPEGLRVDRLLGEWRVAADSAEGRRRFAAQVEARRQRKRGQSRQFVVKRV